MKIRLASELQIDSIVDGEGIRTVIWTQGCPHNCPSCHNPNTHDFSGGFLEEVDNIIDDLRCLKGQTGITFSGGDPMCQPEACALIASAAKELGYNIWCYTGYTYEQLMILAKGKKAILDFLNNIDVLVDGKFVLAEKSLDLKFKGSRNQRVIDIPKSLTEKKLCLLDDYENPIDNTFRYQKEANMFL